MIYVNTKDVDSYDKLVYLSQHLAGWRGKSIVIKPPHNKLHYVKYIFTVINLNVLLFLEHQKSFQIYLKWSNTSWKKIFFLFV